MNVATEKMIPRDTGDDEARVTSDSLVGRVLDAKYELTGTLGEGGMGAVYRARRLHIGDEVAVKVLHQKFLLDESAVERFRREARSAALIGHPNVVTIHDFGESRSGGAPAYIVMELVKGVSLRALLKREGRLTEGRAAALMRDICSGVGVAHRQGVIHRDLKPDNVIIVPPAVEGEREVAKVVDFGIAKLRDMAAQHTLTQTGVVLGTPYYMAPEQCKGESLDARADVYSLGAMLYEMVAGVPPFRSTNLAGLISKHLNEPPPPLPLELNVKSAFEDVCRRALSKNPDERQADALVLSRELQAALDAPPPVDTLPPKPLSGMETVRAEQVTAPATQPQMGKSHGVKWAVVGLLVLLVFGAGAGAVVWYTWDREPPMALSPPPRNSNNSASANVANANVSSAATNHVDEIGAAQTLSPEAGNEAVDESSASQAAGSNNTSASQGGQDLKGEWTGTYGPLNTPATLLIKESGNGKFRGTLQQGAVRVAFSGSLNASTRQLTFKETQVLSGEGWSLGENTGTLSADGKSMTGRGGDAMSAQLGMSYNWTFSKR
jgi:serine/threonine-protein kinase